MNIQFPKSSYEGRVVRLRQSAGFLSLSLKGHKGLFHNETMAQVGPFVCLCSFQCLCPVRRVNGAVYEADPHSGVCAPVLGSVVEFVLDVSCRAPGIITLALLRSEMSTSLLSSGPSSNSDSLGSLSHSESSRSFGSDSVADLSGCSFSLSFCACASLECLHFIRRFWNQTLT